MPPWLVIVGAGYLVGSTAFLLAMGRAAALGDARRHPHKAGLQSRPQPSDGSRRPPKTRPLDVAS